MKLKTHIFFLKSVLLLSFTINISLVHAQMNHSTLNNTTPVFSEKFNPKNFYYDEEEYYDDTASIYKGWSLGLNFGFYFANKSTANFYNGSGTNDIGYVLNNQYWREPIEERIGYDIDTSLNPPWELPQNMKYDPAMSIGFYAKYNFSKSFALFFQTSYVKLKTSDIFILHLRKYQSTLEPTYRQYGIMGAEERFNIEVGVCKEYEMNSVVRLYVETGLNMVNTKVLMNKIQVEGVEYSIVNVYGNQGYVPNTPLQEYDMRQGGVGWGIFFGTGVRLVFNEHVSIDPGFTLYLQNIVIKDNTNFKPTYSRFSPSYVVFFRFTFRDFF